MSSAASTSASGRSPPFIDSAAGDSLAVRTVRAQAVLARRARVGQLPDAAAGLDQRHAFAQVAVFVETRRDVETRDLRSASRADRATTSPHVQPVELAARGRLLARGESRSMTRSPSSSCKRGRREIGAIAPRRQRARRAARTGIRAAACSTLRAKTSRRSSRRRRSGF